MAELAHWDSFYVIVGSAAGALVGLQFVVLTLVAERPPEGDAEMAGAAFATPTIVHFGAVLLVAAVLRMPWHSITALAVTFGLVGLFGIVYSAIVAKRLTSQSGGYKPDLEDWISHVLVPMAGYVAIAASAIATGSYENDALFALGAAVLLLLFSGIHNAWDSIAYHVFVKRAKKGKGRI
jgi:hypothetical protein